MTDELARLQSTATSLNELTERITATADAMRDAGDEATATDLYDIERALRHANRKLHRFLAARR